MLAKGEFKVKLEPQHDEEFEAGRLTINKEYSGDMTGTGKGQMLSYRSVVEGSAGYVAIEKVNATLEGKNGSFVLQHSGSMHDGQQSLSVVVVPDSGDGDLRGIVGDLAIIIKEGQHFYEFKYEIA